MKNHYFAVLLCIALLLLFGACAETDESQMKKHTAGETGTAEVTGNDIMRAMYVTFGENSSVFIEQKTETVFYATFPEEIYDRSGEKISREQLVRGNIVEITGNGIMAESYPGQYHGITKMQVVEEGNPADADQYQYVIDQIYQEPDPSLPPELSISYTTDLAAVCIAATNGGYEWSYTDENGMRQSVTVDGSHILDWEELMDASIQKPTEMVLWFSENPVTVTAQRWTVAAWHAEKLESETLESEAVETVQSEEGWHLTAEPGYVYLIKANWDNGQREFGFYTPAE